MAARPAVTATFDDPHSVVGAVRSLHQQGFHDITIYGPVMEHELEDAIEKPASPVRRYALIGGILGCTSGFLLTIWTSYYYPLVTGGKPLSSIPAYIVIAFELTILFAGISALIGMLIHNRMPRTKLDPDYDASFSEDTFGIHVACPSERAAEAEAVLRGAGPQEVHRER